MKKLTIALVSLSVLVLPVMALAQGMNPPNGVNSGAPVVGNFAQIIADIENTAAMVFGAIAVIMFVIAGVYFLTAGGEPEKIQKARQSLIWGVAGVVVGIIAFSIIAIVGSLIH